MTHGQVLLPRNRQASPWRRVVGFWLVAGTHAIVMMGGTLPIPLYRFWTSTMHFGAVGTTSIFAVYAFGVLISLLVFASLSDRLGCRPVLSGALVVLVLSTALFLSASSLAGLLLARFVFGIAAGAVTATANAALTELRPPERAKQAAVMSTVANMGGLGLGSVAAGAVARVSGDPTHEAFWFYLVALGLTLVATVAIPETVMRHRTGPYLGLPRPTFPPQANRRMFLGVLGLVLAAFAVNGVFSSLVPTFVQSELGINDPLAASSLVSIVFFAALAQLVPRPRWLLNRLTGPSVLVTGILVFEAGLLAGSLTGFIVGTILAGAGVGLVFGYGIAVTQGLADPGHRAGLFATYFLAAYLGSTVPTLALGVLNQALGTTASTLILFGSVVGITAVSTLALRSRTAPHRIRRTTSHEGVRS